MLLLVLACGIALFIWRLGSTGLVDETPPLFAASARAMAETGDWLTPRVNGLPRYDKPPLVYWLMGLGYLLPGQSLWNPLGSWAASLPSALSSVVVMLALAATLLRWPQPSPAGAQGDLGGATRSALTAFSAALAFALSPLVLIWSRVAVSDSLFTATLALSLLLFWRRYADPECQGWWPAWLLLGLAVLTKGPVALVLVGLTLALFAWWQGEPKLLMRLWRPLPGLVITAAVALPWYGAELLVEGEPFWQSFFGYHNLQRFTSVVNHHLQPWWFFGPMLVVASLPFTPLLLLGLAQALARGRRQPARASLGPFAACWLLVVFGFFTLAATKLPSYWLPATPAAGVLIALAAQDLVAWRDPARPGACLWRGRLVGLTTLALTALLCGGLLFSAHWIPLIQDPEMPTLPAEMLASGLVVRAGLCFGLALAVALALAWSRWRPAWLAAMQLPLVLFGVAALEPLIGLGDRVRQLPVRQIAAEVVRLRRPGEPLAMVGTLKPSLHYYTRQVVIFEGLRGYGLVNLADRLQREWRQGQRPSAAIAGNTVLVVMDRDTSRLAYWQPVAHTVLAHYGLYQLWRVDRLELARQAQALKDNFGVTANWQDPRPERY
ncbi:MAG: glycosyltransferase family 39 protein [Synechococcales cyanobacterium SupBloom_Metag_052]|nr:glycosyltransferase family 39 protein [Synechococcales cyanobacterium SupBloom_Metag_052]